MSENLADFDVQVAPLPQNFSGGPQALANAIAERLIIRITNTNTFFVISNAEPASNEGPWFNTSKNPAELNVFDEANAKYVPAGIPQERLKYIVSQGEPSNTDFDIWYRVDSNGDPIGVLHYNGTVWKTFGGVGQIVPFAYGFTPVGYLPMIGQSVLKADYQELYNAFSLAFDGTALGSSIHGELSSSHFTIPDLRGYQLKGYAGDGLTDLDYAARFARGDGVDGSDPDGRYLVGTREFLQGALLGTDTPTTGYTANFSVNWCIKY